MELNVLEFNFTFSGEILYIPGNVQRVFYNMKNSVGVVEDRITAKAFHNPINLNSFPDEVMEKAIKDPESVLTAEQDRIKFITVSEQIKTRYKILKAEEEKKKEEEGEQQMEDTKASQLSPSDIGSLMGRTQKNHEEIKF